MAHPALFYTVRQGSAAARSLRRGRRRQRQPQFPHATCGRPSASKWKKNPSFFATPFILAIIASRCAFSSLSSLLARATAALSLKNLTNADWTGSAPDLPPLRAAMEESSAAFLRALSDENCSVTAAVASVMSDILVFSVTLDSSAAIMPRMRSTCPLKSCWGLIAPAAFSFSYVPARISFTAVKSLTVFWLAFRNTSFVSSASMTLSSASVCSLRRPTAATTPTGSAYHSDSPVPNSPPLLGSAGATVRSAVAASSSRLEDAWKLMMPGTAHEGAPLDDDRRIALLAAAEVACLNIVANNSTKFTTALRCVYVCV